MSMKQISVFVENKPGALYALTAVLAQGQIDMRALSLAETKDFGIVRLIVNDLYKTTTLLKDAGYVHSLTFPFFSSGQVSRNSFINSIFALSAIFSLQF